MKFVTDDAYKRGYDEGVRITLEKKGEQKPAWSEEDDDNIMMIEDRFSDYLDYIREDSSLTKHRKNTIKEEVIWYVNWLKSLKQRYTWKPSEDIPYWKKSTLPNDSVTGFNSDFFSYNGYCINYKELFDKLPKEN